MVTAKMVKYDDLVVYIGDFGPFQRRAYFLTCLPAMSAAIAVLINVFILAVPEHRCAVPGLDNDTFEVQDDHHQALINYTLPWTQVDEDGLAWGMATCNIYKNSSALNFDPTEQYNQSSTEEVEKCQKWVYDKSVFTSTYSRTENMVCAHAVHKTHAISIYMVGVFVGSFFFGLISDWYGRKNALMMSIALFLVTSVPVAFASHYAVFVTLRFFAGMSQMGIFMSGFVLGMEIVGPKTREFAGIVIQLFWCLGMMILDLIAYYIRDWQVLQLSTSCYAVVFFSLWWLLPESPRWLISQGRVEEARVILEKAAKANGSTLPDEQITMEKETVRKERFFDIFKSGVLSVRLLIVFINWLVVTMVYYGLTLNAGSLGGNIYLNFALSGIVEILGNLAALWILPRWGRKRFHCFSMMLSGFACLAFVVPSIVNSEAPHWVTLVLSNIGKFAATGGFSTIYIFTAELFPTSTRNSVMGACSAMARIGAMAAPYVADLSELVGGKFGSTLPYIIFGASTVFGGLLSITLPETHNKKIPETMQDSLEIRSGPKKDEEIMFLPTTNT